MAVSPTGGMIHDDGTYKGAVHHGIFKRINSVTENSIILIQSMGFINYVP
jgi:hypothetical protein